MGDARGEHADAGELFRLQQLRLRLFQVFVRLLEFRPPGLGVPGAIVAGDRAPDELGRHLKVLARVGGPGGRRPHVVQPDEPAEAAFTVHRQDQDGPDLLPLEDLLFRRRLRRQLRHVGDVDLIAVLQALHPPREHVQR